MGKSAHKTLIEFGARSVAITAEALTQLDGLEYRIVDAARRLLDPLGASVVYGDGVVIPSSGYTIDHLSGRVIFASAPTAPVTMDTFYIPRVRLACPRSFTINCERVALDTTCMAPETEARSRKMGLKDHSVSTSVLEDLPLFQEYTIGGEVMTLADILNDDSIPLVISIRPGNVGDTFRAFVKLASHEAGGELDDLIESGIEFVGTSRGIASYSWSIT